MGVEYNYTLSLTPALDRVGWSTIKMMHDPKNKMEIRIYICIYIYMLGCIKNIVLYLDKVKKICGI